MLHLLYGSKTAKKIVIADAHAIIALIHTRVRKQVGQGHQGLGQGQGQGCGQVRATVSGRQAGRPTLATSAPGL